MPTPVCHFDHLVIASQNLTSGVAWFEQLSGVRMPVGGRHPRMGTHNHLSATGENSFVEIIAVEPDAAKPDRPRWFSLDAPATAAQLSQSPRLLTWVVNTTDIDATLSIAAQSGFDAGEAIEMTRGDLRWRIAVRADGALVENGTFPTIIEWPAGAHPASAMTDQGLRVNQINLMHPQPERLRGSLAALGMDTLATVKQADGQTPGIEVELAIGDKRLRL